MGTKAAIDSLTELVNIFISSAPTKDDFSKLATKDDLKGLASKEDLTAMKEEVKADVNQLMDFRFGQMDQKLKSTTEANSIIVKNYEARIQQVESHLKEERERNRVKQVMNDMYNRRLNILLFGIEDDKDTETRDESEKKVREILITMQVDNASTMKFIDCHRLPRKKKEGTGKSGSGKAFCRPIIFRLDNMFDVNHIYDKLKTGLKAVNEQKHRDINNRVYMKRDLPKELLKQKRELQHKYQELYVANKSPSWYLDITNGKFFIRGKNKKILAE